MKTFLFVLSILLCSGLLLFGIAYLVYALDIKQDAKSYQRIRFRELEKMYAIAPEKWSPPDYDFDSSYVYYKESKDAHKTRIYMTSFLGTVRLMYELKSGRRKFSKQIYMEDRAKLLKAFQKDINEYVDQLGKIHKTTFLYK